MTWPSAPLGGYSKTAVMAAASYIGDSPLFVIDYLLRIARVIVLLSIWRTILPAHGSVSGMTQEQILTYTLIAEVFAEQLACRTRLEEALWEGTIAVRFLQPMGLVGQFGAEMAGRWCIGLLLFSLPLLLMAPLLGVRIAPAGIAAALAFVVSLVLAILVGLAIEFIFGGMVVALEESVWLVSQMRTAITVVLSGTLIPLAVLPWGLGNVFDWLPFAATASAPLRIYTGSGPVIALLLSQLAWAVVLWPTAHWLWRRYRDRLVGYGG